MMFEAGDTVVVHNDLYGGTYRLFESVFRTKQIRANYVDLNKPAECVARWPRDLKPSGLNLPQTLS